MRIGIDIKAFRNGTTGIARYLRSIMDSLQEIDTGNEYVLFECSPSDYTPRNQRWRKVRTHWRLPGILWQQLVLPFLLRKHRIDLLWAPEQVCPVFFTRNTRIVTTIHDLAYYHYPETFVLSTRLILRYFARGVARRSDRLVAGSNYIKQDFLSVYGRFCDTSKLVAIPDGRPEWSVPEDYRRSNRKDFLLFVGNIEPRKNLTGLIKALGLLHGKGLDVPLHITGPEGWKSGALRDVVRTSGVETNVSFLGYVTDTELKNQYLQCKAFVYPSLYEGFGLPVLEALSLDCLVLTSKDTVMQETAEDTALYFDPHSPADIAEKIAGVLEPGFDRTPYLRGRENVLSRYSWRETARRMLAVFSEVGQE